MKRGITFVALGLMLGIGMSGALRANGATQAGGVPLTADSALAAIEQAEAARQAAADLGYEWLKTKALIKEARMAAAEEDWQRAVELATEARLQGELAAAQAAREAEAWQRRVVR